MNLSNEYLAGFFDGEGCVYFTPNGRVSVNITQKRTAVLYKIKEDFGGAVRSNGRACKCSQWTIGGRKDIKRFLSAILPYSVVKKAEVEIGLEAVDLVRTENFGCMPLTSDEIAERKELSDKLQMVRPTTNYTGKTAAEKEYRNAIKEKNGHRCQMCGKDLRERPLFEQIITSDEKLICRKCHPKRFPPNNLKPIAKETIENAIANSKSLFEACEKLGISRATLYDKRKKFGLV